MKVAVVGHVEWIRFASVERMPAAGEIAHSTDDWEQAGSQGIGEVGQGAAARIIRREDVTELGQVLIGEAHGRRSAGDITLFDSSGLAIQDLAIAKVAYARRHELDLQTIEL